jgi:hypothetical protein
VVLLGGRSTGAAEYVSRDAPAAPLPVT